MTYAKLSSNDKMSFKDALKQLFASKTSIDSKEIEEVRMIDGASAGVVVEVVLRMVVDQARADAAERTLIDLVAGNEPLALAYNGKTAQMSSVGQTKANPGGGSGGEQILVLVSALPPHISLACVFRKGHTLCYEHCVASDQGVAWFSSETRVLSR